jgi:hypothetical protein
MSIGVPNGGGFNPVAMKMIENGQNMSADALRPYSHEGKVFVNANGKAVPIIRNATTLRKDEWKHYDTALVEAAKIRLNGVARMQALGLTYNIPNGFGKTVLEYEEMSEMNPAEINMDGVTRGKNDRLEFVIKYLPLPIVHKAFTINARVLAASRTTGQPLDTLQATEATFEVASYLENMLYNGPGGSTYTFGGGTISGYTNFPQRITGSLGGKWDDYVTTSLGATAGEQILADVLAMMQASINAKHYGPWDLHVPKNYEMTLEEDYTQGYAKPIRARLLELQNLGAVIVSDKLADDNVVLAQTTANVQRMVVGMPISNVEWSNEGGMVMTFKVMTIQVPQLRADYNGNTGIVHYTG